MVPAADARMREGAWSRNALIGPELEGKTLGIIGLGAIGKRVARQALGFRMRVISYDPNVPAPPADLDVKMVPFEKVLAQSDFVSLHPRLNSGNFHMIDAKALGAMKKTACLINTARGELVDEAALIEALKSGRIANAALDVFEKEPHPAEFAAAARCRTCCCRRTSPGRRTRRWSGSRSGAPSRSSTSSPASGRATSTTRKSTRSARSLGNRVPATAQA